jgi:hypothetical protein
MKVLPPPELGRTFPCSAIALSRFSSRLQGTSFQLYVHFKKQLLFAIQPNLSNASLPQPLWLLRALGRNQSLVIFLVFTPSTFLPSSFRFSNSLYFPHIQVFLSLLFDIMSSLTSAYSQPPVLVFRERRPRALRWQVSENGTYPDEDRVLTDDNSRLLVLDPQACEICQGITISALTTKAAPYGFEHHSSKEALLLSANQGCRLCIWVCFASFFEPWLEGQAEKDGTRPPTEGVFPLRSALRPVRHQYAPILRYSKSLRGITILNPYEATDRNVLRVYTNYRSFSPRSPYKLLIQHRGSCFFGHSQSSRV